MKKKEEMKVFSKKEGKFAERLDNPMLANPNLKPMDDSSSSEQSTEKRKETEVEIAEQPVVKNDKKKLLDTAKAALSIKSFKTQKMFL
ncbi:hypothetical protein ACLOJK_006399 [Asimina triloba]